jgi:outer membrane lipoprotein SlyB
MIDRGMSQRPPAPVWWRFHVTFRADQPIVAAMTKTFLPRLAALAAVATVSLAAGCATTQTYGASDDVRALAIALQTRDLAGIEARINRPMLEAQVGGIARAMAAEDLGRRFGGGAGAQVAGVFAADLAGPIIEALARRALQPDTLADFARKAGITPDTRLPGRTVTALALQKVTDERVCAPDPETRSCLLYFGRSATGWRLDGINEAALRAKLAPASRTGTR